MGMTYNLLTDELGFENYLALCVAIIGYDEKTTDTKTGRVTIIHKYPSVKQALSMMGIKTNEK